MVLHEFGFDGLFQQVIESAAVGIRKPDERIFLLAIEALGLQPDEVAVVGDSIKNDIEPAHRIGCHTIWYKGEQWNPSDQSADITIGDMSELISILSCEESSEHS